MGRGARQIIQAVAALRGDNRDLLRRSRRSNGSATPLWLTDAGALPTETLPDGTKLWKDPQGRLHREHGPALVAPAREEWRQGGELHREGAPALIHTDGRFEYYEHGRLHRSDGPAVENPQDVAGTPREAHYRHGLLHRDADHPAVVELDGAREWWENGTRHRSGAPALIRPDGQEEWWHGGALHRSDGPAITEATGTRRWYVEGVAHREDGAAVEHADGSREWLQEGVHHREGGPAIEPHDASAQPREWFVCGERHREDGPAMVWPDRGYGPKARYYQQGQLHRADGPAKVDPEVERFEYFEHGLRHRVGGPAYISRTGRLFWRHGVNVPSTEKARKAQAENIARKQAEVAEAKTAGRKLPHQTVIVG